MICFDANIIRRIGSREETSFTLMRGLARLTGHPLALPQTVLEELLGHYKRTIIETHDIVERNDQRRQIGKPERAGEAERLTQARDVLLRQVPWWTSRAEFFRGDNAALPLIDAVVEREEQRLRRLFTIVTKPAGADEEGNRREIDRRPLALHDGDSGKGLARHDDLVERARRRPPRPPQSSLLSLQRWRFRIRRRSPRPSSRA